ncbi:hypothetical protein D9M68_928180 [compost metagenome]
MQVPVFASIVEHLAEQQATAIAQARVVAAELVPGIDHRPRFGLVPQLVPGEQLGEHFAVGFARVEVEQRHGGRAGDHQAWLGDRLGQHLGGEGVAQAGEAVVEGQVGERLQGNTPAKRSSRAQGSATG